jgi:protein O-mannosyl-transferase
VVSAGVQPAEKSQNRPQAGLFASPGKRILVLGFLLLVATLVVYFPVHRHPFVNLDDDIYVTHNAHVSSGLSWKTVTWAFTSYTAYNWHPLTWISHALDCQLFGLNPAGHHDVNLLLHLMDVILVFWVFWRATGYAGRSLMLAALFALHPLNVESVAWVAERKTMLSMLFFLLALGAYRWYARQPGVGRYVVVAALFALGLMAKPQVITLPCVLLLWDYWPLGRLVLGTQGKIGTAADSEIPPRSFSFLLQEKLPLGALCLISAYLTMKAQRVGRPQYWPYSYPVRLENAIVAYAKYILKGFWPSRLAPMYLHPGNTIPTWQVVVALFFLLVITALVVRAWRRRYLTVGWLWFLGTMVPMIGLLQVGRQSMADRYAYLPFLGLFLMLCWGVGEWSQQLRLPAMLIPGLSVVVLLALSVVTHHQLAYWADNVTLWTHTLEVTDRNWFAECHISEALKDHGRPVEAAQHLYKALAMNPNDIDTNLGVALYEHESGNLTSALQHYKVVMAKGPEQRIRYQVLVNMAHVYSRLGDQEHAREYFEAAAKEAPKD